MRQGYEEVAVDHQSPNPSHYRAHEQVVWQASEIVAQYQS